MNNNPIALNAVTMKERGNRKKMRKRAALLTSLCISIGHGVANAERIFLRRHRLEKPSDPISGSSSIDEIDSTHDELSRMEELWQQAAAAAQVELDAERILWYTRSSPDFSMSMPSRPPSPSPPSPRPPPRPTPRPPPQPTPQPTPPPAGPPVDCLQGRTREEYIYDLLIEVTPGTTLNDPSTPQGRAFDYLANDDPYLSDPCVSSTIQQRYGLTTMYYSFAGEDWNNTQGWLGQDQECLWFGVDCLGSNPNIVTRVTLSNNNLIGRIPDEIRTLDMLERLDLFDNTVTGMLPTTISELSRLILLDVEQNLLSGEAFPTFIYDLSSLLAYRASENFLSGTISSDIRRLSDLQQVWVATNQLTGSIPSELASLSDLESIFLYQNLLVGTLPVELGSLTNLKDLRLYQNTIQNNIPTQLFAATGLESLRLEFNFFSGTFPTEVGALTSLKDLQIDTNGLSGTLPSEIGNLSLLENVVINNNFLSGQIPNVFQVMNNLEFMDAANNLFFGTIPESMFEARSLRLLYLSNNTLSGTIPPEFSRPSFLRDLYLDGNGLTGTVPDIAAGELEELNEFLVHFNFLSGSMPASICNLRGSEGNLDDLFSDCGGTDPEIACDFPGCCNRCFEGGGVARRRRTEEFKGRKPVHVGLNSTLQ